MNSILRLWAALQNLRHKSRRDRDEAAELSAYMDLVADELVDSGIPRMEAERIAAVRCGGRTQLEQTIRDLRTGIEIVVFWHEVRIATRQLIRQPLFTSAAVASLALGMGATTAIFTAVYSLILRPLPYPDGDHLVFVSQGFRGGSENAIFAPDFMAMRSSEMHSLEQEAGFVDRSDVNLIDGSIPERLKCVGVTSNFLNTLEVHPQLGRDLLGTDDNAKSSPVALISDRLWRTHFEADSAIIGKSVTLDGGRRTIIGVLPRDFVFPDPGIEPDILVPANVPTTTDFAGGPVTPISVIARMREGATLAQVDAEARAFFTARERFHPSDWARPDVSVETLQEHVSGNIRKPLLLLLACMLCILMVVCANVGNLQLARTASRMHEFSVRRALGASRSRLIQQFLIENLLLTTVASLLGLALACASRSILQNSGFLTGKAIETAYGAPAFAGLFGNTEMPSMSLPLSSSLPSRFRFWLPQSLVLCPHFARLRRQLSPVSNAKGDRSRLEVDDGGSGKSCSHWK